MREHELVVGGQSFIDLIGSHPKHVENISAKSSVVPSFYRNCISFLENVVIFIIVTLTLL